MMRRSKNMLDLHQCFVIYRHIIKPYCGSLVHERIKAQLINFDMICFIKAPYCDKLYCVYTLPETLVLLQKPLVAYQNKEIDVRKKKIRKYPANTKVLEAIHSIYEKKLSLA